MTSVLVPPQASGIPGLWASSFLCPRGRAISGDQSPGLFGWLRLCSQSQGGQPLLWKLCGLQGDLEMHSLLPAFSRVAADGLWLVLMSGQTQQQGPPQETPQGQRLHRGPARGQGKITDSNWFVMRPHQPCSPLGRPSPKPVKQHRANGRQLAGGQGSHQFGPDPNPPPSSARGVARAGLQTLILGVS